MQQAIHEQRTSPLVHSLRTALSGRVASGGSIHPVFESAVEVFSDAALLIGRIAAYARITVLALDAYAQSKPNFANTVLRNPSTEDIWQRASALIHQGDAEFLEHEGEQRSEHVLAQACISIWSALEAGVEDMLFTAVRADRTLLEADVVRKIEVKLFEFHAMNDDERTEFVVTQVEEKQRSKFSRGVGRFEDTLKAFGLGGAIDDRVRRELLEFSALRNCLVHRRGIVDTRFARDCPTSNRSVGSRISIAFDECWRYEITATYYLLSILARLDQRYGTGFDQLEGFKTRLLSDMANRTRPLPDT